MSGVSSRPVRRSGLVLLAAWTLCVAVAFQRHHAVPWASWLDFVKGTDWGALVPTAGAVGLALARLAGAALLWGSAACAGHFVLRWLWPDAAERDAATTPGERFWLSALCGMAVFTLTATALAAAGLLYAPLLWAAIAVPCVFGGRQVVALLRACVRRDPDSASRSVTERIALAGMVVVVLAALPVALSPQVLHDSLVYHLALPRAYLDAHGFVPFPQLVFANTPLNTEMLYALALTLGGPPTAKLVHVGCGVGMLALTASLGRRLLSSTAGTLAAFLTLTTPLVLGQLPTSYVDLAAGFAFTGAVWGVVQWLRTHQVGPLRVAAVALGLFAGMRYTSVYGVAAVGAVLTLVLLRRRAGPRQAVAVLGPFAIALLVGAGPWLVKNAIHVGNPIFPLATGVFGLGPLTAGELARTQLLVQQHGMGHGVLDLLLLPWRVTVYGNPGYATFDGAVSPVWLVALPAVLTWRRMPLGVRALALFAAVYAVAWAFSTHVARYLIPVFPLFSLLAVGGLLRLVTPSGEDTAADRRWVGAGFAAAGLWWVPAGVPTLLGLLSFGAVAWGREAPEAFLLRTDQTARMYAFMDRTLPADAKIIGLWENRMLRCPRPLDGDAVYEAPRWLDTFGATDDAAALARDLRARGYSHLLLNARHLARYPPRPTSETDAESIRVGLSRLKAFTQSACTELFMANEMYLYEIRGEDTPKY